MTTIIPTVDQQYHGIVESLLNEALQEQISDDRTGAGRHRLFGTMVRFDLQEAFPLLQSKKTFFSSVVKELAWFLKGDTNISTLGCSIWDEWAWARDDTDTVKRGDIGPMYGKQWVDCPTVNNQGEIIHVNQIRNVINELQRDPNSSRLIVNSWNPGTLPIPGKSVEENLAVGNMGLAPCHFGFQLFSKVVKGERILDLMWHQRSVDTMLGLPFNIACYAILTQLIGNTVGIKARQLVGSLGDIHIYGNHIEQVRAFLKQSNAYSQFPSRQSVPQLKIPQHINVWNLHEHVDEVIEALVGYEPQPHIKFPRN